MEWAIRLERRDFSLLGRQALPFIGKAQLLLYQPRQWRSLPLLGEAQFLPYQSELTSSVAFDPNF